MNETKVWLIEARDKIDGKWYPCWYSVYYSKMESMDELDKLLISEVNGFNNGLANYRTRRYERVKK